MMADDEVRNACLKVVLEIRSSYRAWQEADQAWRGQVHTLESGMTAKRRCKEAEEEYRNTASMITRDPFGWFARLEAMTVAIAAPSGPEPGAGGEC